VNTIAVISAGNYVGAINEGIVKGSLGKKLRVVNLVNESLGNGQEEIIIPPRRILRPGEREEFVLENMPNAGKVRDYTDFQPVAYGEFARDRIVALDRAFSRHPDYVSLGVGSGKLFIAIERAIRNQGLPTKLIGLLPKGENGVFNQGTLEVRDNKIFSKQQFNPQSIADKLVCPYTALQEQLLAAQGRGHVLAEVDNIDLYSAFIYAQNERHSGEPSATAGFMIRDPGFRAKCGIRDDSFATIVHTGYGDFVRWSQRLRNRMPAALLKAFRWTAEDQERSVRAKDQLLLRARPWARSNERFGENYCT